MTEPLGDSLFTNGNCGSAHRTTSHQSPAGEPSLLRPSSTKAAIKEHRSFR